MNRFLALLSRRRRHKGRRTIQPMSEREQRQLDLLRERRERDERAGKDCDDGGAAL